MEQKPSHDGINLFVDDIRQPPDGDWVTARTITEAIRILATRDVRSISLDHDISHYQTINAAGLSIPYECKETFEPVAWFLREMFLCCGEKSEVSKSFPKVTLHTANPIGAKKMAEILADAGIVATIVLGTPVNGLE